jgi:hypothetical protein
MPDLVVTIRGSWLTIDGALPRDYRLFVHNHSRQPDFYPFSEVNDSCHYGCDCKADEDGTGHDDDCDLAEGVRCYLYIEDRTQSVSGEKLSGE